ncbi:MAG: DASS family sodium-coupled anion symporter [Candidatus Marinimicrobia bacterium]|nr:DASS family sodium-coupled anion symporter [Candidatus Neomarinimicrobiota bacterium]MBL7059699.1 DASS family sodium-coupled anion symporter [Candidatus Neomarinimicrobiota bacterium]
MLRILNQYTTNLIYGITRSRWLVAAFLIGFILFLLPSPEGLTVDGYRTIIIIIVALILIITEPIPLPGIALLIIILQVYFGIADANHVAHSFMNDAVFFIMGSLMLAVAIVQQGWDARIALGIIRLTGNSTLKISIGFIVISAVMSSFIGEHTVAAMMLPIGMTLIRYTSDDKTKVKNLAALLLFSIAYGSLIGSIGTPSGGGRNAIMMVYWKEFGLAPISYGKWMLMVYPLVLLQLPLLTWILWKSFVPEYLMLDSGIRKLKVQVARSGMIQPQQYFAVFLFFLVFLGWIFYSETVGLGIIALTGVVMYLVTGLAKWEEMSKHVNWGVVILFGATISLGTMVNETGAAQWIAGQVLNFAGEFVSSIPVFTDLIIVLMTTTLANILSSSATVAVLAPITLNLPGDSIHIGLITAIASAFGYFTAVAAPACTIIYASGMIKAKDFLKAGWKVGATSILMVLIYANIFWKLFG